MLFAMTRRDRHLVPPPSHDTAVEQELLAAYLQPSLRTVRFLALARRILGPGLASRRFTLAASHFELSDFRKAMKLTNSMCTRGAVDLETLAGLWRLRRRGWSCVVRLA